MEHIVQFGINIDDGAIKNLITTKAAETIVKEVKRSLEIDDRYGYRDSVVTKLVNKEVDVFLVSHKDEIIKEAGKDLAARLVRTKKVKEMTAQVIKSC